jgi:glyoxylase-like metal-dependent hydrolase (beta-lactamase superfamily II)
MRFAVLILALFAGTAGAEPYHFIPGRVPLDWQGPDGNTIVLDAPKGLIVFDTGRSPMHAQAILDYAKQRDVPIAAIINSHWHLDHTTGNYDLRQAYPDAKVYASTAINGALETFLAKGLSGPDKALSDPSVPQARKDQILRARFRVAHPDTLRPTDPVVKSGPIRIAGRVVDVHLAKFAATERDVWLYDAKSKTVIAGDLVVGLVPFLDTACPEGWSKALGEIAALPFKTLIPGHGEPMTRADFQQWRTAYDNFVDCGHSTRPGKECVQGWSRDAAKFIDAAHKDYAAGAAGYYLQTRLRSSPDEQQRYCRPLSASTWVKPAA